MYQPWNFDRISVFNCISINILIFTPRINISGTQQNVLSNLYITRFSDAIMGGAVFELISSVMLSMDSSLIPD